MNNSDQKNAILARYQRAQILEGGVWNKNVAFNTTLIPHWIGQSDCFWYIRETRNGQNYRLVDAKAGTNTAAFDHQALANALQKASGENLAADNLLLTDLDLASSPKQICFSAFGKHWVYDHSREHCEEQQRHPENWKLSPDGRKAIFVRDYNLWLHDLTNGEEKPLTRDGEKFYRYASTPTVYGREEAITLEALWSPDSKRVFTQVLDTRDIPIAPPIIEHVPADGSLRPNIINPDRRVAFPGDKTVESYRFLSIPVDSGQIQFVDYRQCPVFRPPYVGYFTSRRGWWDNNSRHAYFIDQERGGKLARLLKCDTHTGDTDILFEETSDFSVTLTPMSHMHMLLMPLLETNELIWFSERSGQAHLYLYDLQTGALKKPITQGDWRVRNVLHFDAKRRELFIQTAGRVEEANPYYCDICRVNIDTGELTSLTSSNHEYIVCDQRSRISVSYPQASGVSPSGQYIVTTRSRVDTVPVSVLLDRNGQEIALLETADVSGLPDNCHWPEPVMLTAADGKTDIYGVIFRPSDFDPDQTYPVLDCTYNYAGPVGSFTNNSISHWHYLSAWAYAELGFIAVVIFNRGNDGLRDTTFNAYQDPVMPLEPMRFRFNKEDCVAGIKQLAARHAYMDLTRVGIVEFASIPTAVAGLLIHPDFYSVGVSVNAQLDSRLFASIGTKDEGYPEFESFASNLRGKLLFIHGMLEDVIPPTMLFRLVEALQKENKSFDMLLLPNLGHGLNAYTIKRSWDYVVEHLLELEPPEDFKLESAFG